MGYVDSDSHVIENEATWSYLDPSESVYKPIIARFSEPIGFGGNTIAGSTPGAMWVVDDTWASYVREDGNQRGNANEYDPGATTLSNPSARLQDLDALGIDIQLLISTFFIGTELDNPLTEAALTRSYNRWMADVVTENRDRLCWTLRPPLRSIDRTFQEMEFGKAHGAVGLHIRGIEHGMFLSDPYFYPVWQRAQDLDLAVIVHVGESTRRIDNQFIGKLLSRPPAFIGHLHKIMAGFHAVLSSDMHERFPRLRWGFVEGGATWVPAILHQQARLAASGSLDFLHISPITPEQLEEKNIFVACEADEDIPYLTKLLGENVLCIGTDYGHNDVGSELAAHATVVNRADIDESVALKIVDTNGRRMLGLPASTTRVLTKDVPRTLPHVRGAGSADGSPLVTSVR